MKTSACSGHKKRPTTITDDSFIEQFDAVLYGLRVDRYRISPCIKVEMVLLNFEK